MTNLKAKDKRKEKTLCLNCGNELKLIKDPISKTITGFIFRCSKCNLLISKG